MGGVDFYDMGKFLGCVVVLAILIVDTAFLVELLKLWGARFGRPESSFGRAVASRSETEEAQEEGEPDSQLYHDVLSSYILEFLEVCTQRVDGLLHLFAFDRVADEAILQIHAYKFIIAENGKL